MEFTALSSVYQWTLVLASGPVDTGADVISVESPTAASHWSGRCLSHAEADGSAPCDPITVCVWGKCLMLHHFVVVVCFDPLHSHARTTHYRPSLFGSFITECTILNADDGDFKKEQDDGGAVGRSIFFSRYFSTLIWMYIYSLKIPVY